MIPALEDGGSGDPCFINLRLPATELFKTFVFLGAPLARRSVLINTPNGS